MAKKPVPAKVSAYLSIEQIQAAIPKIKRRYEELSALDVDRLDNETGGHILDSHVQKVNATLRDIYGANSIEYDEYSIETFRPQFIIYHSETDFSIRGNLDTIRSKVGRGVSSLKTLLEILQEQAGDEVSDVGPKAIKAYAGLDLHSEIARAASRLYLNGHYANAVEAAVKALNGLVRMRSGLEFDGVTLMERAFSPSNPVLKFNDLQNQTDKDEQKGFMQMFSGAVSGLRNPRAHEFIHDDPERALEFIAFISLLAKLLDEVQP